MTDPKTAVILFWSPGVAFAAGRSVPRPPPALMRLLLLLLHSELVVKN